MSSQGVVLLPILSFFLDSRDRGGGGEGDQEISAAWL